MNLGECLLVLRRLEVARAHEGLQRLETTLVATAATQTKKAAPVLKQMAARFRKIIWPEKPKTESRRVREMKQRLKQFSK